MGQERRGVLLEAIRQEQRDTAGRQHLDHLMHHTLGHRQGARADIDGQQQFALGIDGRPHPVASMLKPLQGVLFADLASFDAAQHGIQLIELQLSHMQVTEEIRREGPQVLGRFHQPVQHGIGGYLEHSRGGANTQALRQARQHTHDQLHGDPFAMKQRAMGLEKIAFAGATLELPPRATAGMAVRAQIA
jgi:hypothetical protein